MKNKKHVKAVGILTIVFAVITLARGAYEFLLPIYLTRKYNLETGAREIGIIGGADGPTAVFVTYRTSPFPYTYVLLLVTLALTVVLFYVKKRRNGFD